MARKPKGEAATRKGTVRLQVWIALKSRAYLELLGAKGTHGVGAPDVAKGMIERGIQAAIAEGILTGADIQAVQGQK